jgi:hypothetical protein
MGPFPPGDAVAAQDPNLTKCRKCGYFNRFFHRNFTKYRRLHPTGFLDWCHCCGVVSHENDFAKVQATNIFTEQGGDVCLGTKQISFSIFAHDPRVMSRYKDQWKKHEHEWVYDEAEMQHDLFRHRFGERPTLDMILESIPILEHHEIPKDGCTYAQPPAIELYVARHHQTASDRLYEEYCGPRHDLLAYWRHGGSFTSIASADETEGIHLKSSVDIVLFRQLRLFEADGFCRRKAPTPNSPGKKSLLSYDIKARWDKKNQVGVRRVMDELCSLVLICFGTIICMLFYVTYTDFLLLLLNPDVIRRFLSGCLFSQISDSSRPLAPLSIDFSEVFTMSSL